MAGFAAILAGNVHVAGRDGRHVLRQAKHGCHCGRGAGDNYVSIRLQFCSFDLVSGQEVLRVFVAGCAGCILGCLALNIMRRGIDPGGHRIKVGQQVLAIIVITGWRGWHMPNRDIGVWAFFANERISSNEESEVGGLSFKKWIASFFTDGHMAAIATRISDGMTDLTRERVTVLIVHQVAVFSGRSRWVTIETGWRFRAAIAMIIRNCGCCRLAMQFRSRMTFDAIHPRFPEVYVAWNLLVFSQKLIPNPAAVTGRTGTGHGGSLFEDVPAKQPSTHVLRLVDMALAA